jgi:uncharacterized protein YdhG (YjbR/CyaY superfamily)
MDNQKTTFASVDEYIATFPDNIQSILNELRATVKAAAPDAEEKIAYQMPAYALKGSLVYFGAWKTHIGFYPTASTVVEAFADELSRYKRSKGTIQFPLSEPLPLDLISKIVKMRITENLEKAELKKGKKK